VKAYERTENGTAARVSVRDALNEVNHAMMDGKRNVRSMSSSHGNHSIEYKDGRTVRLVEVEELAEDAKEWSGTRTHFNHMHRFGANGRALCNSRIWPQVWHGQNDKGVILRTRAEIEAGEYAHLYTFCPHCEAKP
jgi:hypothetical protein